MADTSSIRGVLIVGAGPTGLTLALWLTRLGVPVRMMSPGSRPEKVETYSMMRAKENSMRSVESC